jgi:hypothetical protein
MHPLIIAVLFATAAESPVLHYIPKHEELKYTFGGVAPSSRWSTPSTPFW